MSNRTKNEWEKPADGAEQSDYDFYMGFSEKASTDDPIFTGSKDDKSVNSTVIK